MSIDFSLYLITDEQTARRPERVARALAALPQGFAAVQLRAKALGGGELINAARSLRVVTREYGALLFVNHRVDVAVQLEADGIHLPSHGITPKMARTFWPQLAIGASTHSLEEARRAVEGGADFVTFGPVWETPSKAGLGEPVGVERLADAVRALDVPVFALGGIHSTARATECAFVGARVACLSAVLGSEEPGAAARAYYDAIQSATSSSTVKRTEH